MEEMGYKQTAQTTTYEDNMACIYMSRTSVKYHKARHIDTRVYQLREMCQEKEMVLEKVATQHQTADALTKAVPRPALEQHRDTIMGVRGVVKPPTETDKMISADGKLKPSVEAEVIAEVGPLTGCRKQEG